jgi:hypothetical protein
MRRKAKTVRKRRKSPPRETIALARFPFLRYLFFLNVTITDENWKQLLDDLERQVSDIFFLPIRRVVYLPESPPDIDPACEVLPGDLKSKQPIYVFNLFRHASAYEGSDVLSKLQDFQSKLRGVVDQMIAGNAAAARTIGTIIGTLKELPSQRTQPQDTGPKPLNLEYLPVCPGEKGTLQSVAKETIRPDLFLITYISAEYLDTQIWVDFANSFTQRDWRKYLGCCPIANCQDKYFLKRRADQRFCSSKHRALWKMRASRGQDPETGQRKRDVAVY